MQRVLIGRIQEQQILKETIDSNKAELVAITGRRRIGKTFLVEAFYGDRITFQIIGIQGTSRQGQLRNFTAQLTKFIKKRMPIPISIQQPADWFDAFLLLIDYLESQSVEGKQVVFLDELYMTMGGIPHYLESIQQGLSAIQNIEQICFSNTGLLKDEFSELYHSLFTNADKHVIVIRTLAKKRQGLTRTKIVELGQFSEGGSIQKVLGELQQSGFISVYNPFGKKKKEQLFWVFLTTFGVKANQYSLGLVAKILTIDDLF